MNDAHDNAADDKARLRRYLTDEAITAFRISLNRQFQLDQANYQIEGILAQGVDMDRYVEVTEQYRQEDEERRDRAARQGKLPKDGSR